MFKNKTVEAVLELEKEFPGDFEKIHHLVRGENYRKVFQETGDVEDGVWSAGTVMGLINEIKTCQALCDGIVEEAERIIQERLALAVVQEPDAPVVITPHWVVKYQYVTDMEERRSPHRAEHIALARAYKADGRLVMGGALADLSGVQYYSRACTN